MLIFFPDLKARKVLFQRTKFDAKKSKFETSELNRTKLNTIRRKVKMFLQFLKILLPFVVFLGKVSMKNFSIPQASMLVTFAQKMKLFEKKRNFQTSLEIPIVDYATHALVKFSRSE